jgi:hypothetical protein
LRKEQLSEHIKSFNYVPWVKHQAFESFLSYETITGDPSPGPAAILFFHNGNLFAILHGGELDSKHFPVNEKVAGYIVSYISNSQNELVENFKGHYYEIFRNAN